MMDNIEKTFTKKNLRFGRLISGSKSGYLSKHPQNNVMFNANIFTPEMGKIWYGDLDLTLDCKILQEICEEINSEMIIVYEMYGRFGAENRSYDEIMENAHALFTPGKDYYLSRVYSGISVTKIDNISIVSAKGINWKEVKFNIDCET